MTATMAETMIGRKRISPPRTTASRSGRPSSYARRIDETSTTPFSTLTPKTAMYPTAAEMLKLVPERNKAIVPPDKRERQVQHDQQGMTERLKRAEEQHEDDEDHERQR